MNSNILLALYLLVGMFHLIFILTESKNGRQFTKILLMPLLILWAYSIQPLFLLLLALCWGWAGDVLLLRKERRIFLKLGLFAFLLGHISYISLFLLHSGSYPAVGVFSVAICLYAFFGWGMFLTLRAGLGRMALPVGIYIFVISLMSVSAFLFAMSSGGTAWWAFAGSLLFVFSDSALALQLFRKPFKYGRFVVMASYIPAQFLLAFGILFL